MRKFDGEMREWLNRTVSKTVRPKGLLGSNPSLSESAAKARWAGLLGLGIFLAMACHCSASEPPFRTPENFNRWTTHYYLMPEPQKIPAALHFYYSSPMFRQEGTQRSMAAFFAAVFQKDAAVMHQTYDEVALHGPAAAKIFLLNILWLTDNSESRLLLEKAKAQWRSDAIQKVFAGMKDRKPEDILQAPVTDAVQLDMLWARFSATGDPACVQKIISAALWKQKGNEFNMLIGGAASWSLANNARQHPKVLAICKDETVRSSGTTREFLEEIIQHSNRQ